MTKTHVLIAVDATPRSIAAAQAAHQLFGDSAQYTVINVAEQGAVIWGADALQYGMVYPLTFPGVGVVGGVPFVTDGAGNQSANERITQLTDAATQTADDIAHEVGIDDAEAVGVEGDPADAIVLAAQEHGADVIVVGTHQRSGLARLFSPSVSGAVLRESTVPVLLVP